MSNFLSQVGLNVDFNVPTFKMVGGMSIDDIKIKYNWFLNAEVKDAVIGEDANGLVWYSGEWIDGTWEGGTWYAGTFHAGRWKKGDFYSYDIDQIEMLLGHLHINQIDINKSKFLSGTWEGGTFHYGIFGNVMVNTTIPSLVTLDYIVNHSTDYLLSGETYYYTVTTTITTGSTTMTTGITTTITTANTFTQSPIFQNGIFENGWMNASKFKNGTVQNGFINNSLWYNGTFYNGVFLGDIWYTGYFYGGDFSNGIWKDGTLSTYKSSILSRFGTYYKTTKTVWEKGRFINGQFHSGLNILSGETLPSDDNGKVKWMDGTFENGVGDRKSTRLNSSHP
jgi:hypothetical protein